jgi:acetyl-CoA carboxylase carboxyltransferase component
MPKLKDQNDEILTLQNKTRQMGGKDAVRKQHLDGKLTARTRIEKLLDPDSFIEMGSLNHHLSDNPAMQGKETPADGLIAGHGRIANRKVYVLAYDFTVMAGTIAEVNERKSTRIRAMAVQERCPLIWLVDSAGARIQEVAGSHFAESGSVFYELIQMSGVIPTIAAVMGPCAAGTAYIPALCDFIPMVSGTSSMALAGPPLVKAVTGEEVSVEDLGGTSVHCHVSGVADYEAEDDEDCLRVIRKYLSYFPQHSGLQPKCRELDPQEKVRPLPEEILEVLPENSRQPYDMQDILKFIADEGSLLEMKAGFGPTLITSFARIGGFPVGIIASQPKVAGGILDNDSADKGARFINLCDAFNIPLVFLQDVPGFMVGSKVEKAGIIRHGAKLLYAVSRASVPKITLVIRKAYGAGYYAMCGRAFGADRVYAWPSAEISLMGAEGAVNIIFRKQIEKGGDAVRKKLVEEYQNRISLETAAAGHYIDEVIDPRETRRVLWEALELTANKQVQSLPKKHGVSPV